MDLHVLAQLIHPFLHILLRLRIDILEIVVVVIDIHFGNGTGYIHDLIRRVMVFGHLLIFVHHFLKTIRIGECLC